MMETLAQRAYAYLFHLDPTFFPIHHSQEASKPLLLFPRTKPPAQQI